MTVAIRILLAIGVVVCALIGGWAQFWPASFYTDFPTVDLTPPYSEHLLRDYGGATLGLGVVLLAAFIWPDARLVIVAAAAYLVFAFPHMLFHLHHLEHAEPWQATLLTSEVVASVVLPVTIIVLAVVRMRREPALRHPAVG